MSTVVSLRLKDEQAERLSRVARRLGRTPSEAAALLLDESLRRADFAFVEFRDSPVGRQAYLQGTRLAVWQVVSLARHYGQSIQSTAEHLGIPSVQVAAALHYAEAYPNEIEMAIADSACHLTELRRLVPDVEVFEAETDAASA